MDCQLRRDHTEKEEEENMTFVPTSSFYVTLMSHASTREFPHNHSSHFKNRLPKPIRFVGRGWQVGMVSLSLPTIPVVGEQFVNEKDPLLFVRWHEWVYDQDDEGNDLRERMRMRMSRELKVLGKDVKESLLSSAGYHFFQKLVHRYDQERANRTKPKNKWAEENGVKLYPSFDRPPEEICC